MANDNQNNKISLSRRKILAGVGVTGAAGIGAGLGTSALFSDEEQFGNNQLTAGKLDMKVSWEEHYFRDQDEAMNNAHREDGELVIDDQEGFMAATLQDQFPDKRTRQELDQGTADPCEVLGDLPDDLQRPLIELEDVKPGDFGEVTFDFVLCDNPGYVWMNGSCIENAENGIIDPEADAPAEDDDPGDETMSGELVDAIHTEIWYDDDCDNLRDSFTPCLEREEFNDEDEACEAVVLDTKGCEDVDKAPDPGDTIWLCCEDGECPLDPGTYMVWIIHGDNDDLFCRMKISVVVQEDQADECRTIDEIESQEGVEPSHCWNVEKDWQDKACLTAPPEGIPTGQWVCTVRVTDAPDDCEEVDEGDELNVKCPPQGECPITDSEEVLAGRMNSRCKVTVEKIEDCRFESNPEEVWRHDEDWGSENLIFEGSLRDACSELNSDAGLPLDGLHGTRDNSDHDFLNNPELRACYPEKERRCIGFKWELPRDVGNEVQSDSVRFDLGFYTEQCRNNDGSGLEANGGEVDA